MDFWKRRRGEKLYKQWVTYSGLSSETIPRTGVVNSESVMNGERNRLEPYKETFENIGMAIKEVGDRYTCSI